MRLTRNDILGAVADDALQLIIFPTEACNFRCTYCYQTFAGGRMHPSVVEAIGKFLRRRVNDLNWLTISWFGGEPLLALDVIRSISHGVRESAAGSARVAYHADITTNGYLLTSSVLGELLRLGVRRFQISLDGPERLHDSKRVLANGGGTFRRIWDNLRQLGETDGAFTVLVRVHVASDNHADLGELIEMYAQTFRGDRRFRLFLRPLSRLGCPRDESLPVLDDRSAKDVIRRLAARARQLGVEPVTTASFAPICYATKLNSFAIRADGAINKCTVKLGQVENEVGRIQADGSLHLHRERLLKWARGLESGSKDELACPSTGLS